MSRYLILIYSLPCALADSSVVYSYFNLELGLPLTGLTKYENMVKVPDFGGPYDQADYVANEYSCYQEHFASQIVLRRLSTDFSDVLSNGKEPRLCPWYAHESNAF